MNRILAYSAMKIRANPPPLYSVLNPETSSDSDSAKSKGVRFVSARLEANQTMAIGLNAHKNQAVDCHVCRVSRLKLPVIIIMHMSAIASDTS